LYDYEVDLDRIKSEAALLNWVLYLCEKTWMTTERLHFFIEAVGAIKKFGVRPLQGQKISLQSPLHKTAFSLQISGLYKLPRNQLPDLICRRFTIFPLRNNPVFVVPYNLSVAEISFLNPRNEQREPEKL